MYYRQVPPCMMCGQRPMTNIPENTIPMQNMQMLNMPIAGMPTGVMPTEDKHLEMLYPKIYFKIIPMVRVHCDKLESKYGMFFYPSKHEMEDIIDEISEKLEKDMDDDDDKDKKYKKEKCREGIYEADSEEDFRRRHRYGRRRLLRDLIGIVFLNELLARRRPYYGGYGWY